MFLHTSIRTSNLDKTIEFYSKYFGLIVVSRREIPTNNAEIAFLQDPERKGALLELTFLKKQKEFAQPDYEDRLFDHIAFEVRNMQETIDKMQKENVTITDQPFRLSPNGSLIAFVEDPDGILIELIEKK